STLEEDGDATVRGGSALPTINALTSRNAFSEAPRAAGYRASDFVLWHRAAQLSGAAPMSADAGPIQQDNIPARRTISNPGKLLGRGVLSPPSYPGDYSRSGRLWRVAGIGKSRQQHHRVQR